MLVALYCVAQISVVFGSADVLEEEWIQLDVKSPEILKIAQDGLKVLENSNNTTYKFATEYIIHAAQHLKSNSEVNYAVLAKFQETNCLRSSDADNKLCVPNGKNTKYCWIRKNQLLNGTTHVTIHCY